MKSSTAIKKLRKIVLIPLVLSFLIVPNIFGQPYDKEKLAQAKIAYDEGIKLIDKRTAGAYKQAFEKLNESRRLYQEGRDFPNSASSLLGMAYAYAALGKNAEAIELYIEAIETFRKYSIYVLEARSLNNIGLIYAELGDNKQSLEYLLKSLPLRKKAKDLNGEAATLNSLGYTYQNLGEREISLKYYRQALQIRRWELENTIDNRRTIGSILNNIGRIYDELGEQEKALRFLEQSLNLRRKLGDKRGEAITLNNIALIESDLGNLQKSLGLYKQSLSIYEEVGEEFRKSTILSNLGNIYSNLGESQKALELYNQALTINIKFDNQSGKAITLNNLGFEYFKRKQNEKGIEYLNQALAIQKETGDKSFEAITLDNLRYGWSAIGNNQLAIFYGKQSVNVYQGLRQAIQGLDSETQKKYLNTIEKTYRDLADLLIETGRFAQAEQVLRMLKEEEYFDFVRRDADEIKTLNQRISLNEKEKQLLERYSALSTDVTELGQEFSELEKKKQKSSLSIVEEKRYTKLEKDLTDANAAFKLFLDKELVAELSKPAKKGIEYDRNLQARLKKWGEGTVTLYTVVSNDRYRVILTTPNVQIDGKTEISALELNKKIFAYRDALQDIDIDPRPLGKELYDILIKPIEKDLKAAKAKTLVWSLDGTLRYIPFATLSPDGKTYLVEKYRNVIITPKTRNDLSDLDTEWRALGLGVSESQTVTNPEDPTQEIDFVAIPGTKQELKTIVRNEETPNEKGILTGRRFLDKEFTLDSLSESLNSKTSDGKRKFTAVHIASHFQLGSNWANSFLLLGNGQILTLKELKNSPNLDFGDVELVTLSACDTAFTADSNGKEVDSLATVIQSKSGKAVLAALWAVADESTPLLMSEFYRLRKENPNMTKAEAMQKVQKAFVSGKIKPSAEYIQKLDNYYKAIGAKDKGFKFDKNTPFSHPYFWSPFVLIGNWR